MRRCVRMRLVRLHGRVRSILKRDASVVFWPSVVWFPQSLVMDGIAATEMLFGRAGHVIGNGLVVVMSLLLGSDVWVNETKKEKLENWGTRMSFYLVPFLTSTSRRRGVGPLF
ncbi:hypothetical protein HU200_064855 [Digitaria exilis]|uniref:Uncharacterized protein n=1 Tax=Digitaria exilis TaxID=1010633 RepID=A0A835DYB0_9POAL|nr:hypothetical protein HU200_064855 [Digitaria exilis]